MNEPFQVEVNWLPQNKPFNYNEYSREFTVAWHGKPTLTGTAAPEFKGNVDNYNPEEFLVMAISSCHMLSFLALAANAKVEILSYQDHADGFLHKEGSIMKFKEVTLRPVVKLASEDDRSKIKALHDKAHHICFIANSVNFPVRVEASVT